MLPASRQQLGWLPNNGFLTTAELKLQADSKEAAAGRFAPATWWFAERRVFRVARVSGV